MTQHTITRRKRGLGARLIRDFQMNKWKYLMIFYAGILALFAYKPMYGLQIAFKNYRPTRGIEGSKWVGFLWFEVLYRSLFLALAAQYFCAQRAGRCVWFPSAHFAGVDAQRTAQR